MRWGDIPLFLGDSPLHQPPPERRLKANIYGHAGQKSFVCSRPVGAAITTAPRVQVDLLFWLDGTSSGIRALSVVKIRLVDRLQLLFPSGMSPVTCWMEAFCDESHIPHEYRMLMLEELGHLWTCNFLSGGTHVSLRRLLLVADHKQLNILSGVQGSSTSQRCSFCTLPAHLFVLDPFAGHLRTPERTASDAVACADEILQSPEDVASIRRKYDNVADVPFVMLGETKVPLRDVVSVPPCMHNNRGIMESTWRWLWDKICQPMSGARTLTIARNILLSRLDDHPNLHRRVNKWNNTSFRIAFSEWQTLFRGLLESSRQTVPFMASVISFILNSPAAKPTAKRCAALLAYSYLLPRLMGWTTSNLYWHSMLHLVPILRRLEVPACFLSEENFEAAFRPVKKVLRGRSNNHVGNDLLVIRAFGEANNEIRREWCAEDTRGERMWDVGVSLDVILAPCMMTDPVILSSLPGLLRIVAELSPLIANSCSMAGVTCLWLACGDVSDSLVACACGQHVQSRATNHSSGYELNDEAVTAARETLRTDFDVAEPVGDRRPATPEEWKSTDDEYEILEGPDSSSSGSSSFSHWEPRSYYDSDEPPAASSSDSGEQWSKRLRPTHLGDFFSEHPIATCEPEYQLPE